ncbi:hypothetical protein [Paraburkholderia sp. SIMBA_054]|uniref:hypothetical protein n=1 Tax=Paraburkholderia sp. SIMBA_054 TaxID=3085795 RepID=UPI00397A6481
MNSNRSSREALFREDEISLQWMTSETVGLFAATNEQIAIARHVLFDGWRKRAFERDEAPPADLAGACKFASLFFKIAFGGRIEGAHEHQFNVLKDRTIDLSNQQQFRGVGHDESFFGNEEHLDSMRSCLPRVLIWISALDALLSRRIWSSIHVGYGIEHPRRDRSAEYEWTAEVQAMFSPRYRVLRDALMANGFEYTVIGSSLCFRRAGVNVWYQCGSPPTQRTLDLLRPYSQFTLKTEKTCHEVISDRLHRSTDEVLSQILAAFEVQAQALLEPA